MNIEVLRQKIHAIEWREHKSNKVHSFGVGAIDVVLPGGGLQSGALHEWSGHQAAVWGVCASILGRIAKNGGPILWCSTQIDVYPLGLQNYGLAPENVIFAKLDTTKDLLWAMEEGLNTPQLGAIVAQTGSISLSANRRLLLAAQKSNNSLFLLMDSKNAQSSLSTSVSRWVVEPLPSEDAPGLWQDNGIGAPRFAVTLSRCRGAITPQKWNIEWNATTLSFDLLSEHRLLAKCSSF